MAALSISRAWDESKEIFARDGRLIGAVTLALLVLPQLILGIVEPPTDSSTSTVLGRLVALVAALIGFVGQLALVRLAIGPSTSVGESISHALRRFPAGLGALVIALGALALVVIPLSAALLAAGVIEIPVEGAPPAPSFAWFVILIAVIALLIGVRLMMVTPITSSENARPLSILKRSWALTKGSYWPLLGLELLLVVAALVVLLAAQSVGGVVARLAAGEIEPMSLSALILALFLSIAQAAFAVLVTVMLARIYVQLAGRGEALSSVPSSGT